jgi:hypothetical protein
MKTDYILLRYFFLWSAIEKTTTVHVLPGKIKARTDLIVDFYTGVIQTGPLVHELVHAGLELCTPQNTPNMGISRHPLKPSLRGVGTPVSAKLFSLSLAVWGPDLCVFCVPDLWLDIVTVDFRAHFKVWSVYLRTSASIPDFSRQYVTSV